MTERIYDEGLFSVIEAAKHVGVQISAKTALRWCLHGIRGVRLESVKVAGRRMTSREAIRRFITATQREQDRPDVLDQQAADRILDAFGLGRDSSS